MKTKKLASLLCAFALVVVTAAGVFAQTSTDWTQFMGNQATPGVTSIQTPTGGTEVKWSSQRIISQPWGDSNAWGSPIAVGNFIYATANSGKLYKLNATTGAVEASADCSGIPPYFSYIAYGDGKIFVPQEVNGIVKVSAFNADTLALEWESGSVTLDAQTLQSASPLNYYNGYVYFGTYAQDSNWQYAGGKFVCISAADGSLVWQEESTTGYYWNGSAIVGDCIAVSDISGTISTYSLADGTEKGTISAGANVSSTPCYADGILYVSTKSGTIFSVPVDGHGVIDSANVKQSANLGGAISSSPVVYNGRLYVAGGGTGGTAPFTVLNTADLSVAYQIPAILSQSTPLVSPNTDGSVSVYVTKFGETSDYINYSADSSCIYLITDRPGQTTAAYKTLFTAPNPQACSQSIIPGKNGLLYYYNDAGYLYAVGAKAETPSSSSVPPVSSESSPASSQSSQSSGSGSDLDSPPTGGTSLYGAGVLLLCSAAALIILKKKTK